jgi:DNA-binding NarL/FixJ family response regulator
MHELLVVDDGRHAVGAGRAFGTTSGFQVVGEARSGDEAVALARRLQPDLVLLDMRVVEAEGFRCLEQLAEVAPRAKAVVMADSGEPDEIEAAFERGASAYLLRTIAPRVLAEALRLLTLVIPTMWLMPAICM